MSALAEPFKLLRRDMKFEYYQYTPSLVAAIIFVVLFAATTGYHIFQAGKRRTYAFVPLIIGGIFEVIGYVTRALGHYHKTSLPLYITSVVTTLVAPALFAASIYMVLGRVIIFSNGQSLSPIRPSRLTKIFVCGDVFSFLIQCLGGGMVASAKTLNKGKNIILLGLALQIIIFGIFIVCSLVFQIRARKSPVTTAPALWQKYVYTLYISGTFILVRSVFRMIEFGAGRSSVLQTNEAFLYIFDAVLMVGAMVCFNIVHPGEIIGRNARPSNHGDVMMASGGVESGNFRQMK